MSKRKRHSPDFKAKMGLEAPKGEIGEEQSKELPARIAEPAVGNDFLSGKLKPSSALFAAIPCRPFPGGAMSGRAGIPPSLVPRLLAYGPHARQCAHPPDRRAARE